MIVGLRASSLVLSTSPSHRRKMTFLSFLIFTSISSRTGSACERDLKHANYQPSRRLGLLTWWQIAWSVSAGSKFHSEVRLDGDSQLFLCCMIIISSLYPNLSQSYPLSMSISSCHIIMIRSLMNFGSYLRVDTISVLCSVIRHYLSK